MLRDSDCKLKLKAIHRLMSCLHIAARPHRSMKSSFSLAELEAAINYWRARSPSAGEELALCPQAAALAEPYALMILYGNSQIEVSELEESAREALMAWQDSLPSTSTRA